MPAIPAIAAGIGAVGSIYGASKAASAANRAGDLQYQATQDSLALQERMYNQTRADNEPFRQVGLGAAGALSSAFGLPAVSMTGGSAYTQSGTPTGGADWNAYGASNPDVMAWAQAGGGDPNKPIEQQSLAERMAYHYSNSGQKEGRALPMTQPAPTGSTGTPAGYTDPTAVGGYTTPSRPTMAPLDVSLGSFRESPDYQFRFSEGERALGSMASANRGLMSGQRMKALTRYGQGMADGEYTDWRNYVTSQYNTDRNFNEAQYQSDRSRLDNRYDTRNNQLMQLAGFGSSATAQNQSAAQSFANNATNLNVAGAQAKGNAGVNAANAWNQGFGNLMSAGAYVAGQYYGVGAGAKTPTYGSGYASGYNPSWIAS